VPDDCPHRIFQENDKRSSSQKNNFVLDEVKITEKSNAASRMARFALQSTPNNKLRHETLQEFMLVNDGVTVAVEIPVILSGRDIRFFENKSGFKIPLSLKPDEIITGHIDFVQVRNGRVYILDYKPGAKKDKPVAQLTIYALALARLTGLRLYDFMCAWFDDQNYYEFYPLHVVYKRKSRNGAMGKGVPRFPK
jgi:ATP-dependent exoDNAse (exonuclease V) beta subunit